MSTPGERRILRVLVLTFTATALFGPVLAYSDAEIIRGRGSNVVGLQDGQISLAKVSKMMRTSVDLEV